MIEAAGQKPQTFVAECGPFIGVRDAVELPAQDMRRASYMLNCYIELPELGGDTMQRAGFVQRSQPTTISGVTGFTGPTYCGTPYVKPDGTLTNYMLIKHAGAVPGPTQGFFTDGTDSWFVVQYDAPSTYTVAATTNTKSILNLDDAANRMFFTSLGDYAIWAQHGGKVRLLDPATGELLDPSDLTDDVWGRPCIYYGKAFFILKSDKQTIVWSEENDPDIGYQGAGYDNFWTFRQTSNAPLMGLAGTNQYLYVFRQNSITSIEGAVNSDFRSFGTLEGVSTSLGTLAPDSIVNVGDAVWFLDQFCRPHAIIPGRGLVPLWENMRVTLNGADLTPSVQFENWGRFDPLADVVLFRISMGGTPKLFAFCSRTLEWMGEWQVVSPVAPFAVTRKWGATLFASNGAPSLSIETHATNLPLTNFQTQKALTTTDQRDEYIGISFPEINPTVVVTTPRMAADVDEVINTRTVIATGRRLNNLQRAQLAAIQGSNAAFGAGDAMSTPSVAVDGEPTRYVIGLSLVQSRWAQVRTVSAASVTSGERASIGQVRVYGTKQRKDPALP